jgi:hypothetical protein
MQEAANRKPGGFFWENPLAQSIYDNAEGTFPYLVSKYF